MRYTTHTIFGAGLAASALLVTGTPVMPAVVLLGAFGALLPDLDHPKAKGSNMNIVMKIFSIFTIILVKIFNTIFNAIAKMVNTSSSHNIKPLTNVHRSPVTHSLLTVVITGIIFAPLLAFVSPWWWFGLELGVLSHVLIDSTNPSGTPLLWPVRQSRVNFLPQSLSPTTGTAGEGIATVLVTLFLGLMLICGLAVNGITTSDWNRLIPAKIFTPNKTLAKTASKYNLKTADTKKVLDNNTIKSIKKKASDVTTEKKPTDKGEKKKLTNKENKSSTSTDDSSKINILQMFLDNIKQQRTETK